MHIDENSQLRGRSWWQTRSHPFQTIIILTLAASIALNVLLAHKVRALTQAQSARIAQRLLKVGSSVPSILAWRWGGSQELISYGATNRTTVLYVFSPSCLWCARNYDNFQTLVNSTGNRYRFIGISLSEAGLADYLKTHTLKVPIYTGLSRKSLNAFKMTGTPQTIVVSPQGKVVQNWMGAYGGAQKSQVEAFFHVILPGIQSVRDPTVE